MFQALRNFFQSKFGALFGLVFLGLIALAFTGGDVSNLAGLGSVSDKDRIAIVGDRKVSAEELDQAARNALEQVKQNDPTMTMTAFLNAERAAEMVDQLLERAGIAEFAGVIGLRAGDRLVDSELLKISAFRGIDGEFDRDTMLSLIGQSGMTEAELRKDISDTLLARQLVQQASLGSVMPDKIVRRYASLLTERRHGWIGFVPSEVYAPKGKPTDAQLSAYYAKNSNDYIRPERRVIRYASFGADVLGNLAAPTEAQIKQRYDDNAAVYAASESRQFTQLVVPTEAAAKAIISEVSGGKDLEAAARGKGLNTSKIGPVSKAEYTSSTSQAVANAAFKASEGHLAAPAKGGLGWFVVRVDSVQAKPARSLDEVRAEIVANLTQEQRRVAINELSERLEDEFYDGATLSDVAKELKLDVKTTEPATANGRIYGKEAETLPVALASVLQTAFAMEVEEPQLAEIQAGQSFLIYDIAEITPSAPAPLAEIKDEVAADWIRSQGSEAAKKAADRIMARIAKGKSVTEAMQEEKVTLPRVDKIDMARDQLRGSQRIPPVLALLFSMAEGTEKKLEAPGKNGWFVARLDDIEPGKVEADDPILANIRRELSPLKGDEYVSEFSRAVFNHLGVEKNEEAIEAVRAQLTGANVQ